MICTVLYQPNQTIEMNFCTRFVINFYFRQNTDLDGKWKTFTIKLEQNQSYCSKT